LCTRLKIYDALALPTLLYGCETWAIREQDKSRITLAEMKFMRITAQYTWKDYEGWNFNSGNYLFTTDTK